MSEHTELLLGTVRAIVVGWDHIEGKFAFQLSQCFLLRPTAGHEGPECWPAEGLVRRDRRILEMSIIGGEQVELKVLARLMTHSLPIETTRSVRLQGATGTWGST